MESINPELNDRTGRIHETEPVKPLSVENGENNNGVSTEAEDGFLEVEGVKLSPTLVAPGSDKELTRICGGVRKVRLPHGVELKVTVLAVYADLEIVKHLSHYHGYSAEQLLIDDQFLEAFLEAATNIGVRVTFLLPLTGEDFAGKTGDNTVADLKASSRYGEAEELALKDFREFFKTKYCSPGSSLYYRLTKSSFEISQSLDSSVPKEPGFVVKSAVFGEGLVGTMLSIKGVSPQLRAMFCETMASLLQEKKCDTATSLKP